MEQISNPLSSKRIRVASSRAGRPRSGTSEGSYPTSASGPTLIMVLRRAGIHG